MSFLDIVPIPFHILAIPPKKDGENHKPRLLSEQIFVWNFHLKNDHKINQCFIIPHSSILPMSTQLSFTEEFKSADFEKYGRNCSRITTFLEYRKIFRSEWAPLHSNCYFQMLWKRFPEFSGALLFMFRNRPWDKF